MNAYDLIRGLLLLGGLAAVAGTLRALWSSPLDHVLGRVLTWITAVTVCGVGLVVVDIVEAIATGPLGQPLGLFGWVALLVVMAVGAVIVAFLRNRRDGVGWVRTELRRPDQDEDSPD